MKIHALLFGITVFVSAIVSSAVLAHDDGLTCHQHPDHVVISFYYAKIEVDYTETESRIDLDRLMHRVDNSINQQPQAYVAEDVRKLRAAISEVKEALGLVAGLVARADRKGPEDSRQIRSLSRDLYSALRLGKLVSYSAIVNGVSTKQAVVLDRQSLQAYLTRNRGVPDSIIILLDQAAQACS